MVKGLYTSALGMRVQMQNVDVIANNIANADTTGFKRDLTVTQSFSNELLRRLHDPTGILKPHDMPIGNVNLGVFVNEVFTDFAQGRLYETGGAFELGIDGTGFFVVNTVDAAGNAVEKYTRDGSFTLNQERYLVTKEGNYVAGVAGGNILVPDGVVTIRDDGSLYVNYQYIDTIRMTDFENPDSLRKTGDNLYVTTDGSAQAGFTGNVVQGYLEGSNMNSINEMVKMIAANRAYEANQRMVTYHDQTLARAVNEIGKK